MNHAFNNLMTSRSTNRKHKKQRNVINKERWLKQIESKRNDQPIRK